MVDQQQPKDRENTDFRTTAFDAGVTLSAWTATLSPGFAVLLFACFREASM